MGALNLLENFWGGRPDVTLEHDFVLASNLAAYTGTAIAGGSAAIVPSPNGVLRLSGAAGTIASGHQIQIPNAAVQFVSAPGVNAGVAQIQVRQSLSTIDAVFVLGFSVVNAAIVNAPGTDGVFLVKAAGSNQVSLVVRRGGVSVTKTLGNFGKAGVMQEWGFQVNSKATSHQAEIMVYLDGKVIYQADGRTNDLLYAVPDDALLTPSYAFQSGTNVGTQSVDVDYIRARWSRK